MKYSQEQLLSDMRVVVLNYGLGVEDRNFKASFCDTIYYCILVATNFTAMTHEWRGSNQLF